MIFRLIYCVLIFWPHFYNFRYFNIIKYCKNAISQKPNPYLTLKKTLINATLGRKNNVHFAF